MSAPVESPNRPLGSNSASPDVQYLSSSSASERLAVGGNEYHCGKRESGASVKFDSTHPRIGLHATTRRHNQRTLTGIMARYG
jgi:hypothetical protein